jgi:hypothetical protein
MLPFLSETREYLSGELRNKDRPNGRRSHGICKIVFAALPPGPIAQRYLTTSSQRPHKILSSRPVLAYPAERPAKCV